MDHRSAQAFVQCCQRHIGVRSSVQDPYSACPIPAAVYSGEHGADEAGGKQIAAADFQSGGIQCGISETDAGGVWLHTTGEGSGDGGAGRPESGGASERSAENLGQGGVF